MEGMNNNSNLSRWEEEHLIKPILISFIVWNLLNVIALKLPINDKHLNEKDWFDFRNRIVASLHGFTSAVLGAYSFHFMAQICGDSNNIYEQAAISMSTGYFIYDTLAMIYLGLMDSSMLFHHVLCILGLGVTLYQGVGGHYTLCGMFITEISNTAMHGRFMLKYMGYRYTKAYEVLEILYIMQYLYGRLLIGPY